MAIPVGPRAGHRRWLHEALESVAAQTLRPAEVIVVVDGEDELPIMEHYSFPVRVWRAPWRIGSAAAFNCGVGLSQTEQVFLLASDDTLEPQCLERCAAAMKAARDPSRTVVWCGVRYMEDGHIQAVPCGAMMISRSLWRYTGGYPVECAVGAPDFLLLSPMQGRGPQYGIAFMGAGPEPLYNYRTHPETENEVRKPLWPIIEALHLYFDEHWKPAGVGAA